MPNRIPPMHLAVARKSRLPQLRLRRRCLSAFPPPLRCDGDAKTS